MDGESAIEDGFTLHPRNTAFAWRAASPPFALITDDQARAYDEDGFFLLEGAFTAEEMDAVAAAIEPFETAEEARLRTLPGGRHVISKADAITFTIHLVARSEALKVFSRHPVFQGLCHDTLGAGARLYWDQAVYKKPGNPEEFPWHQDNGYTFIEPQQYLTCWVALTDATKENGCPWVIPGLHRLGTLNHQVTRLGLKCLDAPMRAVAVPARKGDIVVFSSLTPHRTGPNCTRKVRKSYILQYAPDGAVAWPWGRDEPVPQNDPARQYPVEEPS
jgi:ectoine hydroxylase-related dioxygenase (phytanoyl-CoA dioxygenase family)